MSNNKEIDNPENPENQILYDDKLVKNIVDSEFRINNHKVFLRQEIFKGNAGFITFYAPWCPHCVDMVPIIQYLAEQLKPYDIKFGSVNCDNAKTVSDELKIEALPSFYFVKENGRLIPYEGSSDIEEILMAIVKQNT